MRRSWALAALAAGVIAVAACSDDPGEAGASGTGPGEDAAGDEQVCAAAERAMTEHGGSVQTALTNWDGSPENVGEITEAADDWGQAMREAAAGAEDDQLRTMLEDLATEIDGFGASWEDPEAEPDLDGIETALAPLGDRCEFGDDAQLAGADENTTDVCAAALEEAGSGSFDDVAAAAEDVNEALDSGDQAALDGAVGDLQLAAGDFAQSFRDIAEDAEDEELQTALIGIATAVEEWAESFEDGEPEDLTGFQEAVLALGTVCD